jgi:uncharacterized protein
MTAPPTGQQTVQDLLHAEFRHIRANVAGVHGSVIATSDGFLVAHDVPDLDSTDVAALLAASRSLASRGVTLTGRGQFREVISRGSHGYVAVYAAGDNAIVGVIGNAELNVAMLHYRVHDVLARVATYASEFGRWATPERPPVQQRPPIQQAPPVQQRPPVQQALPTQHRPATQQGPPAQQGPQAPPTQPNPPMPQAPPTQQSPPSPQAPPALPIRRRR